MSIASNILEKIGNTPLVRINKLNKGQSTVPKSGTTRRRW